MADSDGFERKNYLNNNKESSDEEVKKKLDDIEDKLDDLSKEDEKEPENNEQVEEKLDEVQETTGELKEQSTSHSSELSLLDRKIEEFRHDFLDDRNYSRTEELRKHSIQETRLKLQETSMSSIDEKLDRLAQDQERFQQTSEAYYEESRGMLTKVKEFTDGGPKSMLRKLFEFAAISGVMNRLGIPQAILNTGMNLLGMGKDKGSAKNARIWANNGGTLGSLEKLAGFGLKWGSRAIRAPLSLAGTIAGKNSMEGGFLKGTSNALGMLTDLGSAMQSRGERRRQAGKIERKLQAIEKYTKEGREKAIEQFGEEREDESDNIKRKRQEFIAKHVKDHTESRFGEGSVGQFFSRVGSGLTSGLTANNLLHGGDKDDVGKRAVEFLFSPLEALRKQTKRAAKNEDLDLMNHNIENQDAGSFIPGLRKFGKIMTGRQHERDGASMWSDRPDAIKDSMDIFKERSSNLWSALKTTFGKTEEKPTLRKKLAESLTEIRDKVSETFRPKDSNKSSEDDVKDGSATSKKDTKERPKSSKKSDSAETPKDKSEKQTLKQESSSPFGHMTSWASESFAALGMKYNAYKEDLENIKKDSDEDEKSPLKIIDDMKKKVKDKAKVVGNKVEDISRKFLGDNITNKAKEFISPFLEKIGLKDPEVEKSDTEKIQDTVKSTGETILDKLTDLKDSLMERLGLTSDKPESAENAESAKPYEQEEIKSKESITQPFTESFVQQPTELQTDNLETKRDEAKVETQTKDRSIDEDELHQKTEESTLNDVRLNTYEEHKEERDRKKEDKAEQEQQAKEDEQLDILTKNTSILGTLVDKLKSFDPSASKDDESSIFDIFDSDTDDKKKKSKSKKAKSTRGKAKGSILSRAKDLGKEAISNVTDRAKSAVSGVTDKVKSVGKFVDRAKDYSKTALSGLKSAGSGILTGASKIASKAITPLSVAMAGYEAYDRLKDDDSVSATGAAIETAGNAAGAWGGAAAGGLAGAKAGALLGTVFGPVGTAIGGTIGGLGGAAVGALGGTALGDTITRKFNEWTGSRKDSEAQKSEDIDKVNETLRQKQNNESNLSAYTVHLTENKDFTIPVDNKGKVLNYDVFKKYASDGIIDFYTGKRTEKGVKDYGQAPKRANLDSDEKTDDPKFIESLGATAVSSAATTAAFKAFKPAGLAVGAYNLLADKSIGQQVTGSDTTMVDYTKSAVSKSVDTIKSAFSSTPQPTEQIKTATESSEKDSIVQDLKNKLDSVLNEIRNLVPQQDQSLESYINTSPSEDPEYEFPDRDNESILVGQLMVTGIIPG